MEVSVSSTPLPRKSPHHSAVTLTASAFSSDALWHQFAAWVNSPGQCLPTPSKECTRLAVLSPKSPILMLSRMLQIEAS